MLLPIPTAPDPYPCVQVGARLRMEALAPDRGHPHRTRRQRVIPPELMPPVPREERRAVPYGEVEHRAPEGPVAKQKGGM